MADAITIEDVSKTYASGKHALKKINLTVHKGEFFGLLGANGAGKTTLLGILTSLVIKDSGTVKIFGHDIDKSPTLSKLNIGVVPQEFNFHTFETPLNIILSQAGYYGIRRKEAMPWAEELLHTLQLWEKRNQQSRFLSGGMKRRLMIARALINKPKLLFLDEPTAGVDIEIRSSMWKFLKKINQEGTTIVLTTHYLEEAESLCKRIAIINDGQIIKTTNTRALLRERQQEIFILDTVDMPDKLPEDLNFELTPLDEQSCRMTLQQGQTINDAFAQLEKHHIQVISMRTESNRLEQHILKLLEEQRS